MVLISGVLKGPYGDSRSGVTITMRSMKTSSTVLNLAKSQSVTDDTGRYSLNVEPGAYEVIVSVYGAQPERVGTIEVYTDSSPAHSMIFYAVQVKATSRLRLYKLSIASEPMQRCQQINQRHRQRRQKSVKTMRQQRWLVR